MSDHQHEHWPSLARRSAYTQTYATADKTHANPTATTPGAVTEYTAHGAGATPVTSAGATDLDSTAAALDTLVDECQVIQIAVAALIVDLADLKALVNSVIDDLQAVGLVG